MSEKGKERKKKKKKKGKSGRHTEASPQVLVLSKSAEPDVSQRKRGLSCAHKKKGARNLLQSKTARQCTFFFLEDPHAAREKNKYTNMLIQINGVAIDHRTADGAALHSWDILQHFEPYTGPE